MGKTMFGIPGVNEKSQSGSAIAPGGTPGGAGGGTGSGGRSPSSGQQWKPQSKEQAPMAKPAMAQPKPSANSMVQSQMTARQKSPTSKTMFGMPALNLSPKQGAAESDTGEPENQAGAVSSSELKPQTSGHISPSVSADEKGDAFGATMLGVPAVTEEAVKAAVAEAAPSKSEESRSTAGNASAEIATNASAVAAAAMTGHVSAQTMLQEASIALSPDKTDLASSLATDKTDENVIIEEEIPAEEPAASMVSAPVILPSNVPSAQPSKGLVVGLIVGVIVLIGAIGFVAWKFLFS